MRISNVVRKVEDKAIAASNYVAPKLAWTARKTALTALVVVFMPINVFAGAAIGAVDCGVETLRRGVRAIREV